MNLRIVLVGTTHPGNIGAAARAMKNMGVSELALVRPRHFPDAQATARASGAEDVLERALVTESLDAAIADCVHVAGASARARTIAWPSVDPRRCAAVLAEKGAHGPVAMVFGSEKSGLSNEELDLCHSLVTIPTEPDFPSLNLAMAVQVLTWEWRCAVTGSPAPVMQPDVPPATSAEMEHFYSHLESVLLQIGFLDPHNPRHLMRRLRRLYVRAAPDKNEVNILRGILTAIDRLQDASQ